MRPDEGWRPNRVYRVELLPGVTDLRSNRSTSGTVLTFTHRRPAARDHARGHRRRLDHQPARGRRAGRGAAAARQPALSRRSPTRRGHFSFGPLPAGEYLVSGVLDENRNQRPTAARPSTACALARGKTAAGELWAFVHDTTPPRIREVTVGDSVTARRAEPEPRPAASGSQPRQVTAAAPARLDARARDVAPAQAAGRQPQSPRPPRGHDSADTTARDTTRRDTTAATPRGPAGRALERAGTPPRPHRARAAHQPAAAHRPARAPGARSRGRPGASTTVEIRGVRNVTGVAGDVRGRAGGPRAAAADTTAAAPIRCKRRHAGQAPAAESAQAGAPPSDPRRLASKPAPAEPKKTPSDRPPAGAPLGGPAPARARRGRSARTPRPRAAVVAAVRESLAAARTRRAGPPESWAAEIRERLVERGRAGPPARCSTPPAWSSTPTSAARRWRAAAVAGDGGGRRAATATSSSISTPAPGAAAAITAARCSARVTGAEDALVVNNAAGALRARAQRARRRARRR